MHIVSQIYYHILIVNIFYYYLLCYFFYSRCPCCQTRLDSRHQGARINLQRTREDGALTLPCRLTVETIRCCSRSLEHLFLHTLHSSAVSTCTLRSWNFTSYASSIISFSLYPSFVNSFNAYTSFMSRFSWYTSFMNHFPLYTSFMKFQSLYCMKFQFVHFIHEQFPFVIYHLVAGSVCCVIRMHIYIYLLKLLFHGRSEESSVKLTDTCSVANIYLQCTCETFVFAKVGGFSTIFIHTYVTCSYTRGLIHWSWSELEAEKLETVTASFLIPLHSANRSPSPHHLPLFFPLFFLLPFLKIIYRQAFGI